jgi:abhydrolase domain-containing protein 12
LLKWLDLPKQLLTRPENQVTPFRITTTDNVQLFTWLVAPLGVYAKYSEEFINEQPSVDDIEERLAFKLLKEDPEARLLIYFHGNSATIAQQRRTEEYRSYSSGASSKIFVLAFDYRGFGKSSGAPSETGLLTDAEAIVDWALNRAKISPDRIVLLGHSLGTAVVAGIAHQYTKIGIEFAGLILCAAFTNAGGAFASYSIGGIVPVLAPVKLSSALQAWFGSKMKDTWHSDHRLADIARKFNMDGWLPNPSIVDGGCLMDGTRTGPVCDGPTLPSLVHETKLTYARELSKAPVSVCTRGERHDDALG